MKFYVVEQYFKEVSGIKNQDPRIKIQDPRTRNHDSLSLDLDTKPEINCDLCNFKNIELKK